MLGGGDDRLCGRAAESWEKAGVGFQILDDVKNLTTGNPGKDQRGTIWWRGRRAFPLSSTTGTIRREPASELAAFMEKAE